MKRLFALTPEARNDLREILLDIAEDSPDTAERSGPNSMKDFSRWAGHLVSGITMKNFGGRQK